VEWKGCDVTRIFLPRRYLDGSLAKEFRELRALEELNLHDTNVTGNLDVLKENTALQYLNLKNTRISGDLQSLAKATKLQDLDLRGTQVSGDLVALSNAKGLWYLDLTETKVYGDLVALKTATKLRYLHLSKTKVYGDLVALSNAKGLWYLDLSKTKVSGDVVALKTATDLSRLDLSKTKVSGDVVALKTATDLSRLDLSETKVYGDLVSLANLTDLWTLQLSNTNVSGDLAAMLRWKWITHLGLSGTKVSGHPTEDFKNCCKNLETLELAWTEVRILDGFFEDFEPINESTHQWICPFPALKSFNITRISVNTTVWKLLKPFFGCSELRAFEAAACSLTGELRWIGGPVGGLGRVLQLLDLSSNNVTKVFDLPGNCRAVMFRENPSISFKEDVVKMATQKFVSVDLRNATFADPREALNLLDSGVLKQNSVARTVINQQHGFACYDLDDSSIQISPEKFAPNRLCSCSPGWKGSGADCQMCPENSFTANYDSTECEQCPQGSKAPAGSISHSSCICDVGVLYKSNGTWRCGCREHEAFLDGTCVKCFDLHLNCPSHGTRVVSAQPLKGHTRLENETHAFKCIKPDIRCDAELVDSDVATHNESTLGACRKGYTDILCMDCAPKYFATGNQCEQCHDHDTMMFSENAPLIVAAITVILAVIGGVAWLWVRHNTCTEVQHGPSASGALKEQLQAQVPILLQLCQLWAVVAMLATKTVDKNDTATFAELPYVQALQFSISSLKSAFNLQCKFDGAMVRFVSALLAPVVPLGVMLCCMLLEFRKPGSGITAGLQALTLLYIGGASSTSRLLSCQEVDGAGDILPQRFMFRKVMPYINCHEETKLKHSVDILAFSSAFCYGILIPGCLLYLYARQHVLLQKSRTTVARATGRGSLKVSVNRVLDPTDPTDHKASGNPTEEFTRSLVASAAAYISVFYRGRVQLRIVEGNAIIDLIDGFRDSDATTDVDMDLLSFISPEDGKQQAKQLKCRSLSQMLTERLVLQDVARSDRVISGAKTLLLKYMLCGNIWMEIVQKLVAVFLVSVVASANGFELSVAITLVMAATSAMVQPYAKPQVNRLHCCSFLCLAVAAASFAHTWVWPSRAALAVPFLLAAVQALRPDCLENLAVRLWEELEPQIEALQCGKPVEVTAETYNFI